MNPQACSCLREQGVICGCGYTRITTAQINGSCFPTLLGLTIVFEEYLWLECAHLHHLYIISWMPIEPRQLTCMIHVFHLRRLLTHRLCAMSQPTHLMYISYHGWDITSMSMKQQSHQVMENEMYVM